MSGGKKTVKSTAKKYLVVTKICCGFVNTAFTRGTVLVMDEEKRTFTDEATGRSFTDIRDILIARRNGMVVPWTAAMVKELAETGDPAAPRPVPAKKEPKKMTVIKSDDDENRTIDIRWTKKQPEAPKTPGPLTVVRETSDKDTTRGMTVVRTGDTTEGVSTPIATAPTRKGTLTTPSIVKTAEAAVPAGHAGKFKAPDAAATARAQAAKAARLKSVAQGEKVVQPA